MSDIVESYVPFSLGFTTSMDWVTCVLSDFSTFLADHADCERKASATAMSMVVRFTDRQAIVEPMICLAKEELAHFHAVYRLMAKRGVKVKGNVADPYIKALQKCIRHPEDEHFLDRLLVAGVIEARAHERLTLLANHLTDPDLGRFYARLAKEEAGHFKIFYKLACHYYPENIVGARLRRLLDTEAETVASLPIRPLIH